MSRNPQSPSVASRIQVVFNKLTSLLSRSLFDIHSFRFTPYFAIAGFFMVALASRILFNGMVYQFDYGTYQPDGIHYTIRTLMWLGNSDLSSAQTVSTWYAEHGTKVKLVNPQEIIPQNNPAWPVIAPRVLYPILSIPFVAIFGIPGMLAVPSLSLLVTMFAIYYLSRRKGAPWIGFLIAISISISPTVLRWAIANCTDGLLMAIFSVAMISFFNMKESKWDLFKTAIIVGAACFTRFCLPVWLLLSPAIYKSSKKHSYVIFLSSILFTAPTFMFKSASGKIPASDNFSTMHDYLSFPLTFLKILFVEFAQLAALDRALLIIILYASALSLVKFREFESKLFVAVFLGVFTLGAINGVMGVNFRYQLPLIPFAAVLIISQVASRKMEKL